MAARKIRNQTPIIAFANRLPVVKSRQGWRAADGGLVTALKPVMEIRKGAWVGWDGGASDLPNRVEGLSIDLRPVELTRAQAQGHYYGFSNRSLWPLMHDLAEQPVFEEKWWKAYKETNEMFAKAAGRPLPGAAYWVHDYHLLLLPELLRRRKVSGPIAFFLHIPFPAPELFARTPWRADLLRGMLGADVVSFQIGLYRDNFLRTVSRVLDDVKVSGSGVVLEDGRRVNASAHPISIDAEEFATRAKQPGVTRALARLRSQFKGRRVLLGVDRLDYTKGIVERVKAFEMLLSRRPDLRQSVALVQLVVPSREDVKEYRDLRTQIEREIGRLNGRFTEHGTDVPAHYLYRSIPHSRMLAYYRLADVCLVTPLKDGMNLVAKEFVVAQAAGDEAGVLVLSEFAGASAELNAAMKCNPFDVEGLSLVIEESLEMREQDRRANMAALADTVHSHTVHDWVGEILLELEEARTG